MSGTVTRASGKKSRQSEGTTIDKATTSWASVFFVWPGCWSILLSLGASRVRGATPTRLSACGRCHIHVANRPRMVSNTNTRSLAASFPGATADSRGEIPRVRRGELAARACRARASGGFHEGIFRGMIFWFWSLVFDLWFLVLCSEI